MNTWALVQNDQFEQAIIRSNLDFEEDGSVIHLRNQMFALFHLQRYNEAIILSEKVIKMQEKYPSSWDYIFKGIAYWLSGRRNEAVEAWEFSATCMYRDGAGGLDTLLFLLFASLNNSDAGLEAKVIKSLKKKLKLKSAVNWPGAMGLFLFNAISETQLLQSVSNIPYLKERHLCGAHFAIALKSLKQGDIAGYISELENCISYGPKSYLEQYYYLAKGILNPNILPAV